MITVPELLSATGRGGVNLAPLSVGDYLSAELNARCWTQADLAEVVDRPAQWVCELHTGTRLLTRKGAAELGAAFGTSAKFWLHVQDQHRLWQLGQRPEFQARLDEIRTRAEAAGGR